MYITISWMECDKCNEFTQVDYIIKIARVSSCKYFRLLVRNFNENNDDGWHTEWQNVRILESDNTTLLDFTDADEILEVHLNQSNN